MFWLGVVLGLAILLGLVKVVKAKASPLVWRRFQWASLGVLVAVVLYGVWLVDREISASHSRYEYSLEQLDLMYTLSAQGCGVILEPESIEHFKVGEDGMTVGMNLLRRMDINCEEFGPPVAWEIQPRDARAHIFKEGLPAVVTRDNGLRYREWWVVMNGGLASTGSSELVVEEGTDDEQ